MIGQNPPIEKLSFEDYSISVLRLDKIHSEVSGNKWFKLKYNLEEANHLRKNLIITFGGAFSNHITATAVACHLFNLKSLGIIRGEESAKNNSTLSVAQKHGMQLVFETREQYKQKHTDDYFLKLQTEYPNAYIIPEGGNNSLGVKGCAEILSPQTTTFDYIFCACGTGATLKGLSNSLAVTQKLFGINVLKYNNDLILPQTEILNSYHFGGYAKHNLELIEFKIWFESKFQFELDYVYTAKAFYAAFDLLKKNVLCTTDKILLIHTGGLQGNRSYEQRYNLKPSRHVNEIQG